MEEQQRLACIVVGATGAIGAVIARGLATDGHNVVLVYHTAAGKANDLAEDLRGMDGVILAHKADVTDREEVDRLVQTTLDRFGRVDMLVNTQGWMHDMHLLQDETFENIQSTIALELQSVILCCKAVAPHMIMKGYGRIITIGSDSGKVGASGGAVSSACRAGVIGLSKALARELARYKITVNVVCPGPTESPLLEALKTTSGLTKKLTEGMINAIPMRRLGTPDEIAALALFLAGPKASFITGQAISVSGGLTMQ